MADSNSSTGDPAIDAAFDKPAINLPKGDSVITTGDAAIDKAFEGENGTLTPKKKEPPSWWDKYVGFQESQLAGFTGGVGALAGGLSYAGRRLEGGSDEEGQEERRRVQDLLTYQPRTDEGKRQTANMSEAGAYLGEKPGHALGEFYSGAANTLGLPASVQGVAGAAGEVMGNAPQFLLGDFGMDAAGRVRENVRAATDRYLAGDVPRQGQRALDRVMANQSQGAARVPFDITHFTPETQAEIVRIDQAGGKLNPTALERRADAESLPVPVHLRAGVARDDAGLAAWEFNNRAKYPEIGESINKTNEALAENLDTFRREATPQAVGNNTIQNSQTLIDKLKDIRLARKADITSKYEAAKAANGGDLPMDGNGFLEQARANLSDSNREEFLPSKVKGILDKIDARGGTLTLDQMEAYRTILGEQRRKADAASNGTAGKAIDAVRDALENTQAMDTAAEPAKALYDTARRAAKADFDDQKVNPAYRAAVQDLDITDRGDVSDLNKNFAEKHILGGSQANLRRLRSMFEGDDEANQTMTAIALNHLKQSAAIDPISNTGNFAARGYNKALSYDIDPRMRELVPDSDLADKLLKLGRVARYTTEQKPGGAFNNSGTYAASIADSPVGKAVIGAAEESRVPFAGTLANKAAEKLRGKARDELVRRHVGPGAGIED